MVLEHRRHSARRSRILALWTPRANQYPQWIKHGCTADLTISNCAIPVKAGQVIAQEGSTGYSSNPHLHLEIGQAFGIAAYMDVLDEDHDGNRVEPVPAAYLYDELNIPISGYTAGSRQLDVRHAPAGRSHRAPSRQRNLLRNGDFSAGTDGMDTIGSVQLVGKRQTARSASPACARLSRPIGHCSTRISTTV